MIMKRKYVGILLLATLLATGCTNNPMTAIYNAEDQIGSTTNSYNLDGATQTIEGETFAGEVEKFEGMDTIWTYEATEDMEVEMTYVLNALKGKVKLVLISPDGALTDVIERSDEATFADTATSIMQIKKGTNRLKMVGSKGCNVKFEIMIPCGEFKQLGM